MAHCGILLFPYYDKQQVINKIYMNALQICMTQIKCQMFLNSALLPPALIVYVMTSCYLRTLSLIRNSSRVRYYCAELCFCVGRHGLGSVYAVEMSEEDQVSCTQTEVIFTFPVVCPWRPNMPLSASSLMASGRSILFPRMRTGMFAMVSSVNRA